MNREILRKALKEIEAELLQMSDEEFKEVLKKHEDGDIAKILRRVWERR